MHTRDKKKNSNRNCHRKLPIDIYETNCYKTLWHFKSLAIVRHDGDDDDVAVSAVSIYSNTIV